MSTVRVEFKAEDYELLQSYQRQLKEQDKVIGKLQEQKTGHEKAGKSGVESLTAFAAKAATVSAAIALIVDEIGKWRQANLQVIQQADEIGTSMDTLQRRFRVQSGLRDAPAKDAEQSIKKVATETSTSFEKAFESATAMVSAGFDSDQASGKGLKQFLNILSASNLRDKTSTDAGELATSLSSYLDANKMDKTAENVLKIGARIQQLSETNVNFSAISQLAKQAAGFREQMNTEEQIAAFASLTYVMPSETAATSMAEMIKNLSIAKTQPNRVKALEAMQLKPEDVDFVGEDFMTVMQRLQEGFSRVNKEDAQGYKALLVEGSNIKSLNQILGDRERIKRYIDLQKKTDQDPSAFNETVKEATTGKEAQNQRLENIVQEQVQKKDVNAGNVKKAFEAYLRREGRNEYAVQQALDYYDYQVSIGSNPLGAAGVSSGFAGIGKSSFAGGLPLGFADRNPERLKRVAQDVNKILQEGTQQPVQQAIGSDKPLKVEMTNQPVVKIPERRTTPNSFSSQLADPKRN